MAAPLLFPRFIFPYFLLPKKTKEGKSHTILEFVEREVKNKQKRRAQMEGGKQHEIMEKSGQKQRT
jgi:hypothetical protein